MLRSQLSASVDVFLYYMLWSIAWSLLWYAMKTGQKFLYIQYLCLIYCVSKKSFVLLSIATWHIDKTSWKILLLWEKKKAETDPIKLQLSHYSLSSITDFFLIHEIVTYMEPWNYEILLYSHLSIQKILKKKRRDKEVVSRSSDSNFLMG